MSSAWQSSCLRWRTAIKPISTTTGGTPGAVGQLPPEASELCVNILQEVCCQCCACAAQGMPTAAGKGCVQMGDHPEGAACHHAMGLLASGGGFELLLSMLQFAERNMSSGLAGLPSQTYGCSNGQQACGSASPGQHTCDLGQAEDVKWVQGTCGGCAAHGALPAVLWRPGQQWVCQLPGDSGLPHRCYCARCGSPRCLALHHPSPTGT